jgi:hypothetical protein
MEDAAPPLDTPIDSLQLVGINADESTGRVYSIHLAPDATIVVSASSDECFSWCAEGIQSECRIVGIENNQVLVRAGFRQVEPIPAGEAMRSSCGEFCRGLAAPCGTIAIDRSDVGNPLVIVDENGGRFVIEPAVVLPASIRTEH